jgi:hypothetical protein
MGRAQTLADKPYEAYTGRLTASENPFEAAGYSAINNWAQGSEQSRLAGDAYARMVNEPGRFNSTPSFMDDASAAMREMSAEKAGVQSAGMRDATIERANGQSAETAKGRFTGANNQFIGQQSGPIAGVDSIAGQQGANPYLGQSVGAISGAPQVRAGTNAMMGMDNPYLRSAIDLAQGDVARNYDRSIRPAQDARMAMSGSFGNTGLMAQQTEEDRNFAGELGRISTGMRMQDYGNQQQLHEADVSRRLGADQFNAQNIMGTQQFNAGQRANDLGRNLAGSFQQMNMGLDAARSDAANQLSTQQFNANLGQSDLARNAQLQQQQGQYNSSGLNDMSRFNAGALNDMGRFNATTANDMSRFNATNQTNANNTNASAYNANQQFNTGQANQNSQFNANQAQAANQYNAGAFNQNSQFNAGLTQDANRTNAGALNSMAMHNGQMMAQQQQQGLQGLLGMDNRGLQAAQALGQVGVQQRAYEQQANQSAYDQWMRAQNHGRTQQDAYVNDLRQLSFGSAPATAPQQQQQTQSPWMSALGAGMAAYSTFNRPNTATPPPTNAGAGNASMTQYNWGDY